MAAGTEERQQRTVEPDGRDRPAPADVVARQTASQEYEYADDGGAQTEAMSKTLGAAWDFAESRGRPAAFYFLPASEPIGSESVRELGRCIRENLPPDRGKREGFELDLVVDSQGGDIHAAYHLVSFLYDNTAKFYACVPRYARSAATLLCIAADSICLDELAVVGPLDAQIYAGWNDGRQEYRSALTPFKSLEKIRDFSLLTLEKAAARLYDFDVTDSELLLKSAIDFVRATTGPMLEKMESERLGEYSQALLVGEAYGQRLFRRNPRTNVKKRPQEIVRALVHDYPSHEFIIDLFELNELGLYAERFTEEQATFARMLVGTDAVNPQSSGRSSHPGEAGRVMERLVIYVDPFEKHKDRDAWLDGEDVGAAIRGEKERKKAARSPNPWRRDVSPMYYARSAGRPIYRRSG
ncbi:MAG TPA: hypothetical protein VG455_05830 [Acidimicrobiales bacterium]|nr:hypothetical protein [Acidimicrobiales bacterium]